MNNTINKYIWFTYDGCGLSIAKKLQEEGNEVLVAQVQTADELGISKKEKPEDERLRLSLFDGLLEKIPAKEMIKKMSKFDNKDEYFVVFDFNNLWKYSEMALKLGFTQGFFPTKKDYEFEEDRDGGKDFVKQYYPDLKVAEVHEFKTIEEGIAFLEDTEKVWVLKSYSPEGSTILPTSKDAEEASKEIIGALKLEKRDYEKEGYILEERILDVIEITPAIVFYNGKPIFTDIDIENKPIGSGSVGNMTGCSGNLLIKTDLSEKINKIAFPPKVYQLAKEHIGMFVWDASILIDKRTDELYFGEFCSNRWGWDAFFTELTMCASVSDYFNSLIQGRNPLIKDFGVGVRLFNLKSHIGTPIIITDNDDSRIWVYDMKKEGEHNVSVGCAWDLLVATGADNNLNKAIKRAYKTLETVQFTNGYYRPEFDFTATQYDNSILNRFNHTNHKYYDVSDYSSQQELVTYNMEDVVEKVISDKMSTLVSEFKEMLKEALNEQESD